MTSRCALRRSAHAVETLEWTEDGKDPRDLHHDWETEERRATMDRGMEEGGTERGIGEANLGGDGEGVIRRRHGDDKRRDCVGGAQVRAARLRHAPCHSAIAPPSCPRHAPRARGCVCVCICVRVCVCVCGYSCVSAVDCWRLRLPSWCLWASAAVYGILNAPAPRRLRPGAGRS